MVAHLGRTPVSQRKRNEGRKVKMRREGSKGGVEREVEVTGLVVGVSPEPSEVL